VSDWTPSTCRDLSRAATQNPPEERPYGSKALINACKEHRYLPVFSKRTSLRRELYDQVAGRWKSLGLPGEAPGVRAFETDQPVLYHEQGSFEPGTHRDKT
jgi:hypothetical protein